MQLEKAPTDKEDKPEQVTLVKCYVVGTVTCTAAFVESLVNEVYMDAGEKYGEFTSLKADLKSRLMAAWPDVEKRSTLEKAERAVALAEADRLQGTPEFTQARHLFDLRNYLVHNKPEWVPGGQCERPKSIQSIESKLQGLFALSPLLKGREPVFPNKMLSADCARWALEASVRFAESFLSRIDAKPHYGHILSKIGLRTREEAEDDE